MALPSPAESLKKKKKQTSTQNNKTYTCIVGPIIYRNVIYLAKTAARR